MSSSIFHLQSTIIKLQTSIFNIQSSISNPQFSILNLQSFNRYSENMRPLISIALFVQYTTASLVMASSLVHLVTFADMVSGVTTTIYMISCMFQTFPISYICEQIVEDCELLSRAIFHSNWIGAPTAYTSALKYFIHRTQQPIQFIAGGVFLICLNVNIQVS